jgi:hypothetical protein
LPTRSPPTPPRRVKQVERPTKKTPIPKNRRFFVYFSLGGAAFLTLERSKRPDRKRSPSVRTVVDS